MKKGLKKGGISILLVIIGLVIAIGLGLLPVNLFFAKNSINSMLQQSLGVELEIHGRLSLKLGFSPELSASTVVLRVRGDNKQPLASIDHIVINPALFDLLRGDLHIRKLSASQMVINYCPDVFLRSESTSGIGAPPSIAIDRLTIQALQLECREPDKEIALLPRNINLELTAPLDMPVHAEISGLVSGEKIELLLDTNSLEELLSASDVLLLNTQLSGYNSKLRINAEILNPFDSPEVAATISLESRDPALLLGIAGIEPVPMGPLEINTKLLADLESVQVNQLDVTVGDFSFSATGEARGFGARPYFRINAQLPQLDAGLLSQDMTLPVTTNGREPIDIRPWLEHLRAFDASLDITVGEILNLPLALKNAGLSARLQDGKLLIDQGNIKLDESQFNMKASFDMTSRCPAFVAEVYWSNIDLGNVVPALDKNINFGGHVKMANISLSSCGFSLVDHARSFHIASKLEAVEFSLKGIEPTLEFDSLVIETGYAESGRLTLEGVLMGEQVSAELSFGSVAELLDGSNWPLFIQAKGAGGGILLDGNAALIEGAPHLQAHMQTAIGQLGKLHRWVDIDSDNQLPATAQADFFLDGDSWSASNIEVHLGKSDMRGDVSYNSGAEKPLLTTALKFELLDMNELESLIPDTDEGSTRISFESPADQDRDEWIENFLELPPIDYKLAVTKIVGLDSDIRDITAEGRIRRKLIENARLAMIYEDIEILGNMNVNLQQRPWKLSYGFGAGNVDIGKLLAGLDIMQDITAHADRVAFKFVSEGQSVTELVSNARLESRVESLSWSGQLRPGENSEDELHLSLVEFTAAPFIKTDWSATGDFNGTPVKFWLQSPPLSETFDATTDLNLRLTLNAGLDFAIIDAVIDRHFKDEYKAEFTLSGQRFDPTEISLTEISPPLDDYQLHAQISGDADTWRLSGLQAKLGSSEISGRLQIDLIDDHIKLATRLHSPHLEIDDFVSLTEEWRLANETEGEEAVSKSQSPELSEGFAHIISEIFAEFIGKNALDIELDFEQIYSAGKLFGSGQFQLIADKDHIHVNPFHMVLPGGIVDAEFIANNTENGVESSLRIHMDQLEYSGLLRLADPESTASGLMYMDVNLEATAVNWKQIPAAIAGNLDLVVIPDDIQAGFLDLWASNLIFALLPFERDASKKLNCLVARFEIEEGVMKSKNILLDSTDIIIRGRGNIDLGKEELDLLFAPQAKLEKFLSVSTPIEVVGPFSDFQSGVISGGFVTTMFKWYLSLVYVPFKWLTGERFPADGIATCFNAMDWEMPQSQPATQDFTHQH